VAARIPQQEAGAPSEAAASAQSLLTALRASGTGTWSWDIRADRVLWDDTLCEIYGVSREHAARNVDDFLAFVHPADRESVSKAVQDVLESGREAEYEFRTILSDGSIRWIYDRSSLTFDDSGDPVQMVGVCFDITRRKSVEQSLAESELRLELATAAADIGVWDWDLTSNAMTYSERAKALFGFPPGSEVTYEMVRDATHPEDLPRTSSMARRALDPVLREREPYEYRIIRPGGEVRWMLAFGNAVFGTVAGEIKAVRYLGTIQDITSRKEMEASLRRSETRLRLAIDAGRMAVWEVDPEAGTIIGSPELNRLLGFPEDAAPSLEEMRERYAAGEQERVRRSAQEALARGERYFEVEYRYRMPDDSIRWLLLRAEILLTDKGTPSRVIGVLLDITVQKQAVERQQLLMRELDHRVKNMLATVQSLVGQTLRNATDVDGARHQINARLASLARAHGLLTAERGQGARIMAVLRETLSPFESYRGRIALKGPDVLLDSRSAVNIALITHELITNALKYGALSSESGTVDVRWDRGGCAGARLRLIWQEAGGPAVASPGTSGFGLRLITGLAAEVGKEPVLQFNREGLRCSLEFGLHQG
jgi:PAS domain S-box-containing protein